MWRGLNSHHPGAVKRRAVNRGRYNIHAGGSINENDKSGSVKKYDDNESIAALLCCFIGLHVVNRVAFRVGERSA